VLLHVADFHDVFVLQFVSLQRGHTPDTSAASICSSAILLLHLFHICFVLLFFFHSRFFLFLMLLFVFSLPVALLLLSPVAGLLALSQAILFSGHFHLSIISAAGISRPPALFRPPQYEFYRQAPLLLRCRLPFAIDFICAEEFLRFCACLMPAHTITSPRCFILSSHFVPLFFF